MADWSNEKTLDFIEEYRKYTVLWRLLDTNYKNREERRSALQELGEKYSLDSKSILTKIKCLRSYFHREHRKVLKKKSGSSADEIYRSSWFAYKHMLFILQGDEAREGKDTITTLEEILVSICIWIFLSLSCIACTTYIYLATTRGLHST
jgi:hypothetical protein